MDFCEASIVYILSSRPDRDTHWDPFSKQNNKTKPKSEYDLYSVAWVSVLAVRSSILELPFLVYEIEMMRTFCYWQALGLVRQRYKWSVTGTLVCFEIRCSPGWPGNHQIDQADLKPSLILSTLPPELSTRCIPVDKSTILVSVCCYSQRTVGILRRIRCGDLVCAVGKKIHCQLALKQGSQLADTRSHTFQRVGILCNLSRWLARYRMRQQLPQMASLMLPGKPEGGLLWQTGKFFLTKQPLVFLPLFLCCRVCFVSSGWQSCQWRVFCLCVY